MVNDCGAAAVKVPSVECVGASKLTSQLGQWPTFSIAAAKPTGKRQRGHFTCRSRQKTIAIASGTMIETVSLISSLVTRAEKKAAPTSVVMSNNTKMTQFNLTRRLMYSLMVMTKEYIAYDVNGRI